MSPMKPRERVLAALHHETPDRTPFIFGGDLTTGIQSQVYHSLLQRLGINEEIQYLYDWPELMAADPSEAVLQLLGSDVRGVHDRFPQTISEKNKTRPAHSPYFNDWGVGSPEVAPGFFYPAIHPLKDAVTLDAIENYAHWPDMEDPYRVQAAAERAKRLAAEGEYALIGSPWLLFPLERAMQLQGMEAFLVNLAANPDFAVALLQKVLALCKGLMENFLAATGEYLDLIVTGDDLGTQDSMLISPRMYRRLIKPIHADWIAFIKARTRAKVYYHSDGDIFPLLDDFVEIGVDVLNPVQTSAGKMADLAELKRRYGKNLCFCGGIDTSSVLARGKPEDVKAEVARVRDVLGAGGGYLIASVHSITNDVPVENILALAEAAGACRST